MHYDETLSGPEWFNSYDKRVFEAEIMQAMRPAVVQLVAQTIKMSYDRYGYMPFNQMRVGQDGILRKVPKLQTLATHHEQWRSSDDDVDETMEIIRGMGIDELPQALRVSLSPAEPSDTALFGFRSLLTENVENLGKKAAKYGYLDLYETWLPKFYAVPSAVYDVTSLLDDCHTPGTVEYDVAKMKLQCAYHDSASLNLDKLLLGYLIFGGTKRLGKYGLLKTISTEKDEPIEETSENRATRAICPPPSRPAICP